MAAAACSLAAWALVPPAVVAATSEKPDRLRDDAAALAEPLIDGGQVVGLAVGIIQRDRTAVFGFGRTATGGETVPDGKTVFEIGSVTKVFTGLLLAEMVEDGSVRLDQPVAELLPSGVTVPQRDGRPITLLDLATHSSGLPRLPANLLPQIAENPDNPYASYTVDDLVAFLAGCELADRPGEKFVYSNLGTGLLGHALACRAGTGYEELVVERICKPLGMRDTRTALSGPMRRRLAQGHNAAGKPVANWDIPTLAGAGALRSTADDLLRFVAANLAPDDTPLAAAIRLAHVPRRDIDTPKGKIALAWHIRTPDRVYWHNGQTGGYHSFVGFRKGRRAGVVVLANSAAGQVDRLGSQLLELAARQQAAGAAQPGER
jgi:D-alanyl-D-alanine-carboxypeptidase/D-alanyl-D-alanine-endopeptidase